MTNNKPIKYNNKHNKNNKNYKNNKNKKLTQKKQKGGNEKKEKFEVQSLNNFDFDKVNLSKYIDSNVDWGNMPGIPPQPDCTIL